MYHQKPMSHLWPITHFPQFLFGKQVSFFLSFIALLTCDLSNCRNAHLTGYKNAHKPQVCIIIWKLASVWLENMLWYYFLHTLSVSRSEQFSDTFSWRITVSFEEQVMFNWRRNISPECIFLLNRGYCIDCPWNIFHVVFSWGIFNDMTHLDQLSERIWWIIINN